MTRFVVDCETLLQIAAGEISRPERGRIRGADEVQADAFVTSDRDLAQAVSGLVATATPDALRAA